MPNSSYPNKETVMKRAQELVDAKISFGSLDGYERLSQKNKGDLGQIIEESWFGYKPNSDKDPDFKEAGVELKVSPYKQTRNGVSAKERLVCDIINYMEEVNKTFETSAFWHKCRCICLLSYEWKDGVPKEDLFVNQATLLDEYPLEDLLIIKNDWQIIIDKIRAGQAHLLSEGDTMYLGACTKGDKTTKPRQQPCSHILAKQRAYSLKTTYMTHLLRTHVFNKSDDEHIIKDWHELEATSFEQIIERRLSQYYGIGLRDLENQFGVNPKAYQHVELLLGKMLGISGRVSSSDEFQKAGIIPKTIRVLANGTPKEDMSFPTFKFLELIKSDWEGSDIYQTLSEHRFMFVVFQQEYTYNESEAIQYLSTAGKRGTHKPKGITDFRFKKAFFWTMPNDDIEEVKTVWEKTVQTIKDGVVLVPAGDIMKNNLPKSSENRVAHVRPHTKESAYITEEGIIGDPAKYANALPDGRWMTTQCFWLNKKYIKSVIEAEKGNGMYNTEPEYAAVAEQMPYWGNVKKEQPK